MQGQKTGQNRRKTGHEIGKETGQDIGQEPRKYPWPGLGWAGRGTGQKLAEKLANNVAVELAKNWQKNAQEGIGKQNLPDYWIWICTASTGCPITLGSIGSLGNHSIIMTSISKLKAYNNLSCDTLYPLYYNSRIN